MGLTVSLVSVLIVCARLISLSVCVCVCVCVCVWLCSDVGCEQVVKYLLEVGDRQCRFEAIN